ncbi:MAG: hypothetical protein JST82_16575 [Bacteroidetes bacterium]|nr:hypothetical protein [Bacteroidota bacterium]
MKKYCLLLVAVVAISINCKAQFTTGQGSVDVQNHTDCDIYWNVAAICPGNCIPTYDDFSTRTMNLLGANSSTGNMSAVTYPWYTPPGAPGPYCSNWTWAYADISLAGNGGCETETGRVGFQLCDGTALNQRISFSCTCNGHIVYVDFTFYNSGGPTNNLIVDVHY